MSRPHPELLLATCPSQAEARRRRKERDAGLRLPMVMFTLQLTLLLHVLTRIARDKEMLKVLH